MVEHRAQPKQGTSTAGLPMHYSVGAIIRRENRYLLIERNVPPLGFAGPAGHVDEGEDFDTALPREIREETGLEIVTSRLIAQEELDWNWCSKGITVHHWQVYECTADGEIKRNQRETRSAGWYTKEQIAGLTLELVWGYWFERVGVIKPR